VNFESYKLLDHICRTVTGEFFVESEIKKGCPACAITPSSRLVSKAVLNTLIKSGWIEPCGKGFKILRRRDVI